MNRKRKRKRRRKIRRIMKTEDDREMSSDQSKLVPKEQVAK